jgi:hypothetical protein
MALFAEQREKPANAGGNYPKYMGYFEAEVVGINPTPEEYFDIYQREAGENTCNYLSTESDGTARCIVRVHLRDVKTKKILQLSFWLKDKKKFTTSGDKKYFINNIGFSCCATSEDTIQPWFLKDGRDYRQAYDGEIEFVEFLKTWLGNLDFYKPEAVLQLDWKKVISGNLKEWKELIGHEWTITVGVLATVRIKETAEGSKTEQQFFTKRFFPGYSVKAMNMLDLTNLSVLRGITDKVKSKNKPKPWERFVAEVTDEYGCKDIYVLKELVEYDAAKSPENGKVLSTDGADF